MRAGLDYPESMFRRRGWFVPAWSALERANEVRVDRVVIDNSSQAPETPASLVEVLRAGGRWRPTSPFSRDGTARGIDRPPREEQARIADARDGLVGVGLATADTISDLWMARASIGVALARRSR